MELQPETTHLSPEGGEYHRRVGVWMYYWSFKGRWGKSDSDEVWLDENLTPVSSPIEKPDLDKEISVNHRVLKYQIPFLEDFTMELPADIEIVRVDNQEGHMYIWGKTAGGETREFNFKASKTGGGLGDLSNYEYIGFAAIHIQMELGLYYFMEV